MILKRKDFLSQHQVTKEQITVHVVLPYYFKQLQLLEIQ